MQTENVNRATEGEEARSVTEAISMLGVAGGKSPDVDAHPERWGNQGIGQWACGCGS